MGRGDEERKAVAQGIRPQLDDDVAESTDPALVILKEAMDMCYEPDPMKKNWKSIYFAAAPTLRRTLDPSARPT